MAGRRATGWVAAVSLVFFLNVVPADAAGTKIGFVDVQKILVRSVSGVAARERLEKERGAMQKDIDTRRVELEKLKEELDKRGALLSAEARRERQETLERKARDFRRLGDDFQKDLEKKEMELTQKLFQDIQGVVERFGKQKGYLFIVERRAAGMMYGDPESDVTDEIIKVYDQEQTKAKK